MYTNIDLNDLVDEIVGAINLAATELAFLFNVPSETGLTKIVYTPTGKWKSQDKRCPTWTLETLKQLSNTSSFQLT